MGRMVKNVRPGALAGNLTPLDPADGEVSQDVDSPDANALQLPDGDLDARIAWVSEAEDTDEAQARADAVWAAYEYDGDVNPQDVSSRLRVAVYGAPTGDDGDGSDGPGIASTAEVGTPTIGGDVIEGQEAETDGEGEAVNADTGEVTQPGEPLPDVEQADGDPLSSADGGYSGPVDVEYADGENGPETAAQPADEAQNSTGSDDGGNAAD